jgi:hypothetical protein
MPPPLPGKQGRTRIRRRETGICPAEEPDEGGSSPPASTTTSSPPAVVGAPHHHVIAPWVVAKPRRHTPHRRGARAGRRSRPYSSPRLGAARILGRWERHEELDAGSGGGEGGGRRGTRSRLTVGLQPERRGRGCRGGRKWLGFPGGAPRRVLDLARCTGGLWITPGCDGRLTTLV